jgi:hypothetical protein
MTRTNSQDWAKGVKLLSLLLAGLLWVSVALERTGEIKLKVPVQPEHLPAGLCLAGPPPGMLEVTVSGPRIRLFWLGFRELNCGIDLSGAAAGTASFIPQEGSMGLDRELKVVRVSPASVRVTLSKEEPR